MPETGPATPHPAATVVLLRDGTDGCEVLLVRRSAALSFHGGAWVFPGGRIDPEDYAGGDSVVAAARRAAVREVHEEAGLMVVESDLVLVSRWITPEMLPKRFDTWFFAAPAGSDTVRVDGGEIHDHRWLRPADALAAQRAGEIELPPPTFVTLLQVAGAPTLSAMWDTLGGLPVETFAPRIQVVAGGACAVYAGDSAYETADLALAGPRHRLWMLDSGWRYERTAGAV